MRIGVFDSGLGGLTVVSAILSLLEDVEVFYVADTLHAPYGDKTPREILQYSIDITQHLIDTHHIEALVVACNTATSAAISQLRACYPELILIGTEPGIKPALALSDSAVVGVLATPATLKGEKYQNLVGSLAGEHTGAVIMEQACPGLVEQIEAGEAGSPKTLSMLEGWLAPMRRRGVDTIVLGCTHYPLVSEAIRSIMGSEIKLIHTGEAIAKHLQTCCNLPSGKGSSALAIYTTSEIHKDTVKSIISDFRTLSLVDIEENNDL